VLVDRDYNMAAGSRAASAQSQQRPGLANIYFHRIYHPHSEGGIVFSSVSFVCQRDNSGTLRDSIKKLLQEQDMDKSFLTWQTSIFIRPSTRKRTAPGAD